jgi:DNA-binding NarL/FixJ family response regulator
VIKVLIVDDHAIVREGLRTLLSAEPGIAVSGEAADGAAALTQARALGPDVILMDLVMPGVNGIEAVKNLRAAGLKTPVLMLTSFANSQQVHDALQAGASGYLLKDVLKKELLGAIRAVHQGKPVLHAEAKKQMDARAAGAPHDFLTTREREVLVCIARGLSNKSIATEMGLTEGTVKGYVSAIFDKLGVEDRTQAALYAVKHGLVKEGGG